MNTTELQQICPFYDVYFGLVLLTKYERNPTRRAAPPPPPPVNSTRRRRRSGAEPIHPVRRRRPENIGVWLYSKRIGVTSLTFHGHVTSSVS